ncbi:MAG: hypothetical protein OEM50_06945 [Gammaproteobacteria bacterium]|nr:hypothetical protein [Gammaproteobacteria bacterium]MDH3481439.1 hypothetical protein [Gammaproteobacteria bacterium]
MRRKATGYCERTPLRGWLLAGAVTLLLCACGGPSAGPEEELREWVSRGVTAAENGERRILVGMISPAYADARGNDRDRLENILRAYFLRMSNIRLLTAIDEINVIGDSAAELLLTVGMAGTHDGVLGFSADAYRFSLELENDGDEWVLISARWGELGEELR